MPRRRANLEELLANLLLLGLLGVSAYGIWWMITNVWRKGVVTCPQCGYRLTQAEFETGVCPQCGYVFPVIRR